MNYTHATIVTKVGKRPVTRRRRPQSGGFPWRGPCEITRGSSCYSFKECYIMLHSISSRSIVLPYGKYRVEPTPLPPDLVSHHFPRGSWAPKNRPKIDPKIYQKFDDDLDRFRVVLGCQLGVIFGLFGAQVRPSSVQNTS